MYVVTDQDTVPATWCGLNVTDQDTLLATIERDGLIWVIVKARNRLRQTAMRNRTERD